ncbi:unnamed protein product [Peronospora destructor]|uniref:Uncharacterized protein n=1 Tax=Peronospora destructor TaxID=86335 RepID=A0AAV0URX5_9STRA|nr:unnamed protein product [Peronospora destructor]
MSDTNKSTAALELKLTDVVTDEQPSTFLKLTMSRRIQDKTIAEAKLVPFLFQLLQSRMLSDIEVAQKLREFFHGQPCELLGRRPMYVKFAMPRQEQECRDRLLRVHHVQRNADSPERRVPGLRFETEFITKAQEDACLAFFL